MNRYLPDASKLNETQLEKTLLNHENLQLN